MTPIALALPFEFEEPRWLWLGLLVPLLVIASLRSLAGLDPVRRVLALLVRGVVVLLIACCLAGVQLVRRSDAMTVMFLMDRSQSVEKLADFQEEFIRQSTKSVPSTDLVGVIDFARSPLVEQLPTRGGFHVPAGRLAPMPFTDRTNVAAAIRRAMALFPPDTAKRIVLLTDGNENLGDLPAEARRAKADGIPIDVVPLHYRHRNEIYFDRLIAPSHAEPGEQAPLRMVFHTDQAAPVFVDVYHNGVLVPMAAEQSRIMAKPGSNTVFTKIPIEGPGVHTYQAVIRPEHAPMDTNAQNNSAGAFSFVSGASAALLVTKDPEHDLPLLTALRKENVQVTMKSVAELGEFDLLQMSAYSTIILANIPASDFNERQQEDFASYVKDFGSGLIMLGGDEAFGAGGWIGTPVEKVMPVSFEIKHKRVLPKGALVLIMHSCEIARGVFYAKEMAKKCVDTISSQDYLGVLAYAWSPGGTNWEVPLDTASNKAAIKTRIDRMNNGDMPDFGSAMQMAHRELTVGRAKDAAQKHVIIFSDGDAQPPTPQLLNDYAQAKITVSTVGIGWGNHCQTAPLQQVAQATGGKFYAARNPKELPQIFMKESKVVRRPLIIEKPFRPRVVIPDSELLAGLGNEAALPPLQGFVLTSPKPNPNALIPIVRSTEEGDDPVLAYWQCELGKTVAFASGYWPAWGNEWTKWPGFAKFWAQIIRWTMRQEAPANFDTYTRIEGNRGKIVVDALDKDAGYLNFLQLQGKIIGPGNQPISLRFAQTGPGHYEAEFEADQSGQYLANVEVRDQGQFRGAIRTGATAPFSPEYRDLVPNEALLRDVVEITGGRWLDMDPQQADVFKHRPPPVKARQPTWDWVLAWLLLPLFLTDVAVRRLASWLALSIAIEIVLLVVLLFGAGLAYGPWWGVLGAFALAELVGWAIRFRSIGPLFDFITHTVVALGQAGERSTAALEKLKTVREKARDGLDTGEAADGVATAEAEPLSPSVARRRFDVGEEAAQRPSGDLIDALGGAKASSPPAEPRPAAEADTAEDATARLLRAKKRAKRGWDEKKE
jgi:uncharacterized membrane protein/Mg-chelatase subunit ChlD